MCSSILNEPWAPPMPFMDTVEPCAPVSDEPKPSKMIRPGMASRSAALSGAERIAPPEPMTLSVETSYFCFAS